MQNLNKFTKHELINKIKRLDNQSSNQNQSTLIKIVEYILHFKTLILKITLLTFIIRWIKKYSLAKRLWHIFNVIGTSLLGISLIDIYALDFISWFKDLQIYKWYSELFSLKEENIKPVNKSDEFQLPKRITEKTNENETGHTRISEWINRNNQQKEEVNKDESIWDKIQNNSKIITIITGVIIISGLSWYYFDEIKDGYFSSIEWIKSYFSRPPTDPSGDNSNSNISSTTQSSKESIQTRWRRYFKIEPQDKDIGLIDKGKDIELIDLSQPSTSTSAIDKGKSKVLTSPSLENLNHKAEEAWNDSNSPKSDSSSSTITPESSKIQNIPQATSEVLANMWKVMLQENIKKDISFIENTFASDNELTKETGNQLVKSLVDVIVGYDRQVELLKTDHIKDWSLKELDGYKESLYNFRKWISKYHQLIIPNEEIIEIGNITDNPIKISDRIFKS
jgi:hypothetical protein